MITLDICWAQFDANRAFLKTLEPKNQDRIVADVIMDQEVLPGVGNIIKNEACFNAAVNPLSLIKDVSEGVIRRLVRRTREFSMIFYQCRKTGKPLSKHYKMYRFSECAECGARVTKCHPGEYKRGTYFCPRCQDNREQMVAKKGSLLGWATTSSTPTRPTWQCVTCTLENKGIDITCAACGSKAQSQGNPSTTSWDCSACTLTNKAGNLTCAACGGPRQEGQENKWAGFGKGLKRKRENEDDQGTTMARGKVLGSKRDLTLNDSRTINDNNQQPAKKPTVLCTGHNKPCLLKTVSKEGPNKLRLFHCCALPKAKQCQHFSWADLHHPKCKCGRLTILKEVYKLNQNNGREFFICPRSKKEQCDFFQWNS